MIEWLCPECEWAEKHDPTASPGFYCPECGTRRRPITNPESVADKETMTDKL